MCVCVHVRARKGGGRGGDGCVSACARVCVCETVGQRLCGYETVGPTTTLKSNCFYNLSTEIVSKCCF